MVSVGNAFSNCASSPVSVAAASNSKPPAPSLYPGSTETPLGFFFSWHWLAAQSKLCSDPVELTDAHCEREMLLDSTLERRTGQGRVGLTVLGQERKDFSSQFDGMTMPSID